jgi:hypothetical protein
LPIYRSTWIGTINVKLQATQRKGTGFCSRGFWSAEIIQRIHGFFLRQTVF